MFQVGEYVVYGMNGVCRVEEIGDMSLSGVESEKTYYTLSPLYKKGSRIFTPVDNTKVVMRPVISEREACDLIDEMKDVECMDVADDKHRELAYKDALKSCDCRQYVQIINTVNVRKEERQAQGKKMSACDERYGKQATDSLYGELAVSLNIAREEVEEYIEHRQMLKDMASAS